MQPTQNVWFHPLAPLPKQQIRFHLAAFQNNKFGCFWSFSCGGGLGRGRVQPTQRVVPPLGRHKFGCFWSFSCGGGLGRGRVQPTQNAWFHSSPPAKTTNSVAFGPSPGAAARVHGEGH